MARVQSPPVHWLAGALLVAVLLLVFQAVGPASLPGGGGAELESPDRDTEARLAPSHGGSEGRPWYFTGPSDDYAPAEIRPEQEVIRFDTGPTSGPGIETPRSEKPPTR